MTSASLTMHKRIYSPIPSHAEGIRHARYFFLSPYAQPQGVRGQVVALEAG